MKKSDLWVGVEVEGSLAGKNLVTLFVRGGHEFLLQNDIICSQLRAYSPEIKHIYFGAGSSRPDIGLICELLSTDRFDNYWITVETGADITPFDAKRLKIISDTRQLLIVLTYSNPSLGRFGRSDQVQLKLVGSEQCVVSESVMMKDVADPNAGYPDDVSYF